MLVAGVQVSLRRAVIAKVAERFGINKLNVPRSAMPAVTPVGFSAGIHVVPAGHNPRFHALLSRFKATPGCLVRVNTRFNGWVEPTSGTPEHACRCRVATAVEALAVGDCLLRKNTQNPTLMQDDTNAFEPD